MAASSGALALKPDGVRPITAARSKRKPSMPVRVTQLRMRIHGKLHHVRLIERQRVAAAGVVHQLARGVAVVERMVEAAERQRGAVNVALARVVEHDVEDDPDARRMQRIDGGADLRQAARRQPRVGRHEAHRIVAPAIGKAERRQVALVDPGGKRHELDRVDAEPLQMRDDRGLGQRRHRAALLRRHVGVKPGEGLDGNLVDELRAVRRQRFGIGGAWPAMAFGTRAAVSTPCRMRSG